MGRHIARHPQPAPRVSESGGVVVADAVCAVCGVAVSWGCMTAPGAAPGEMVADMVRAMQRARRLLEEQMCPGPAKG